MKRITICVIVALALLALVTGRFISNKEHALDTLHPETATIGKEIPSDKAAGIKGAVDIQNAFISVAEKVGKSVTAISTERTQKTGAPYGNFDNPFRGEYPLERFFEDFFGPMPEMEFRQQGLGSGFIIDKEGHVLTNFHVIEGADKINVTLSDGRNFEAEVKGADPRSDLAVLEIKAGNLPVVELGDSDSVRTGEWVVALGNPFGYVLRSAEPTVTVGVVSALHRRIPTPDGESGHFDMIQTDAAINPGNSGGPLCDVHGKVIGINVAIFSTTGGYQGVGFAIPINAVKGVLDDLIAGKEIEYGWLGVNAQEITPDVAEYFNLLDTKGALIAHVSPGSPAEKAGLREGDIVTTFNQKEVENIYDFMRGVVNAKIGEEVTIGIMRDRVKKEVKATIGRKPSSIEPAGSRAGIAEMSGEWRGMTVADLTDDMARRLNTKSTEGVVIIGIKSNSPSHLAKLKTGDIIREINRTKIQNVENYKKITSEAKGLALVRTERGYFTVKE